MHKSLITSLLLTWIMTTGLVHAEEPVQWELRGTAQSDQIRLYNIAVRMGCNNANESKHHHLDCWRLYAEAGFDPSVFMNESQIVFTKTFKTSDSCLKYHQGVTNAICMYDDEMLAFRGIDTQIFLSP